VSKNHIMPNAYFIFTTYENYNHNLDGGSKNFSNSQNSIGWQAGCKQLVCLYINTITQL